MIILFLGYLLLCYIMVCSGLCSAIDTRLGYALI